MTQPNRSDSDYGVIVTCMAIEDLPEPYVASERGRFCAGCEREVWFDPRALATAEQVRQEEGYATVTIMCGRCTDEWTRMITEAPSR